MDTVPEAATAVLAEDAEEVAVIVKTVTVRAGNALNEPSTAAVAVAVVVGVVAIVVVVGQGHLRIAIAAQSRNKMIPVRAHRRASAPL